MLTKRVIPCLDVKDGRVVKGVNFVSLRDAGDPVELARAYDREGADEVVFLDITATSDNRATTIEMAAHAAEELAIPYTVGGGFRDLAGMRTMVAAGADKVSLNSAAVRDPSLVSQAAAVFGRQAVVVAIDAKRVGLPGEPGADKWEVFTAGGRNATGIDAVAWAEEGRCLRCWGNPSYQHGLRRHQGWLRPGTHPRRGARGADPGDRKRRRGHARAFCRGRDRGRGRRRAGSKCLSLWDLQYSRSQRIHGQPGNTFESLLIPFVETIQSANGERCQYHIHPAVCSGPVQLKISQGNKGGQQRQFHSFSFGKEQKAAEGHGDQGDGRRQAGGHFCDLPSIHCCRNSSNAPVEERRFVSHFSSVVSG